MSTSQTSGQYHSGVGDLIFKTASEDAIRDDFVPNHQEIFDWVNRKRM